MWHVLYTFKYGDFNNIILNQLFKCWIVLGILVFVSINYKV